MDDIIKFIVFQEPVGKTQAKIWAGLFLETMKIIISSSWLGTSFAVCLGMIPWLI